MTLNQNYGHAQILRDWSGYVGQIDSVIQHGIDFEEDRVYPGEAQAPVCTGYSWSELRDKAWAPHKPVIPGCAPMLYLAKMYTPPVKEREGTVYVPVHGTSGVVVEDSEYYFHLAKSLKDLPQPVTVQLYYQEMNDREVVRQFEKNGIEVVCCVQDVNDVKALKRQLDVLAGVKYAASNYVSTHTMYAIANGVPAFLFGEKPDWTYAVEPGMDELFRPTDGCLKIWAQVAKPFEDFHEAITDEQLAMADYHLGISRMMTPETLKEALEWAASRRWPQ